MINAWNNRLSCVWQHKYSKDKVAVLYSKLTLFLPVKLCIVKVYEKQNTPIRDGMIVNKATHFVNQITVALTTLIEHSYPLFGNHL